MSAGRRDVRQSERWRAVSEAMIADDQRGKSLTFDGNGIYEEEVGSYDDMMRDERECCVMWTSNTEKQNECQARLDHEHKWNECVC